MPLTLTTTERDSLSEVLDLRPALNRKGKPHLAPLSLYSSELKSLKQIATLLKLVCDEGKLTNAPDPKTADRYFNTLSNIGLVEGSPQKPTLTVLAQPFLDFLGTAPNDGAWRDNANGLELGLLRSLVQTVVAGGSLSEAVRRPLYYAQCFFERVPKGERGAVLASLDKLLFLFHIHSHGWEVARYFALPQADRTSFEKVFEKVLPSAQWTPSTPIEKAAAKYKDAANQIQSDVRYRISGFLNAYKQIQEEMGESMPYITKDLAVRVKAGQPNKLMSTLTPNAIPLDAPRQLIVTGCPGSGKSHYVDGLVAAAKCKTYRTQFHPETTFFDFVGAFKPQPMYEPAGATSLTEMDGSVSISGRPLIDYRFVAGVFTRAYIEALQSPGVNVVLLIDELNRGNTAAIFGDLLQLLDREPNGWSKYDVLPAPELSAHLMKQGVKHDALKLPPNLYIWATMNSADQGVFPLDTAFRRRWSYVYKGYGEVCRYPENTAIIQYGGKRYRWDDFRAAVNKRLISLGVHEDKLIGPYFLSQEQLGSSDALLEKLFLYLWDDVLRFRQDELFTAGSFSEVSTTWGNGAGEPLQITLPEPIKEGTSENLIGTSPAVSSPHADSAVASDAIAIDAASATSTVDTDPVDSSSSSADPTAPL